MLSNEAYEAVVIAGPWGAGKGTLVEGLRIAELERHIVIPHRFTDRALRSKESPHHTSRLSLEAFNQGIVDGTINPYWQWAIDIGRKEHYGFQTLEKDENRLPVYLANNAILRDTNESVQAVLASALLVIVQAPAGIREARIRERWPHMSDYELNLRLRKSDDIDTPDESDNVRYISTHKISEFAAQQLLRDCVNEALYSREAPPESLF